jgi:hypothetical protein
VFDKAQQLLADRGEHISKRASNSSDYLLGGLIKMRPLRKTLCRHERARTQPQLPLLHLPHPPTLRHRTFPWG